KPDTHLTTPRDEVILHPTDFSDRSRTALQAARALAQARGARLILLHVISIEDFVEIPLFPDRGPSRAALASLADQIDGPDLKHPVETRLSEGEVATEIVQVADEADCSLIVMGTHGASGLSRLLMGSVAESVLRKAGRPVLIVKSTQPEASPLPEAAGVGRVTV
ncbi:universal stress protein, partial [Singulisphaera rosea]